MDQEKVAVEERDRETARICWQDILHVDGDALGGHKQAQDACESIISGALSTARREGEAEAAEKYDRLLELFNKQHTDAMIAHRWFAKRFGEVMNGRDFAIKCEMADELLNSTEAEGAVLREALEKVSRTPTMPFPDRGAHSERAFSEAVWTAWSRIQQIVRPALSSTTSGASLLKHLEDLESAFG